MRCASGWPTSSASTRASRCAGWSRTCCARTPSLDVAAPASPGSAPLARAAADDTVSLPGREPLLEHTAGLVAQARAGRGGVLLVSGDAGIGKTRFCRAVADQAAAAGLTVGWGTWEQEDGPPLWGWRQALRRAAGRRRTPSTAGGDEPDSASTVFRLADEVADALRAQPVCVVLDDVHWADPDSHRLLRRVVSTLGPVPSLLVVASREVAADRDPEAAHTLGCRRPQRRPPRRPRGASTATGSLRRSTRRSATRWTRRWRTPCASAPTATRSTSARWSGPSRRPACSRAPASTTGAACRPGCATSYATGSRGCRRRWAGRSPRRPCSGRTFDADVLEESWGGSPEELDDALGLAEGVGLVEPDDQPGRYRFVHALARDAVYEELSGRARTRAHARAGAALEQTRVGRLDRHAVALAEHYRQAGPAHARDAWTYAERGASHGAEQGLHADAARLLATAVELQQEDPYLEPGGAGAGADRVGPGAAPLGPHDRGVAAAGGGRAVGPGTR